MSAHKRKSSWTTSTMKTTTAHSIKQQHGYYAHGSSFQHGSQTQGTSHDRLMPSHNEATDTNAANSANPKYNNSVVRAANNPRRGEATYSKAQTGHE